MEKKVTLSVDSHEVHAQEGTSILEAADMAGIYIPRLCYHPDLPPGPGTKADNRVYRCGEIHTDGHSHNGAYSGCNLCLIEIDGQQGLATACTTRVREGMIVRSNTTDVREARRANLAHIMANHPHACLLCAQKEGCDREGCTQGVEMGSRCCANLDNCEFRKVCEFITIKDDVSQYIFKKIPVVDTPFFTWNFNLCIGCTRCVRACEKTQGKRIIGFTYHTGELVLGTQGLSHKDSGCVYCGACVAVCPTGALMEKGIPWAKKAKLTFTSIILPPEHKLELTEENINTVPEISGVYELIDDKQEILFIRGADNIRKDLQEKWQSVEKARFFRYEAHGMYSMRENEMLAGFLNKHGKLPEVNNEISDLY
jgi:predicted molibdopterin-dependent oxidoreductase YjgC